MADATLPFLSAEAQIEALDRFASQGGKEGKCTSRTDSLHPSPKFYPKRITSIDMSSFDSCLDVFFRFTVIVVIIIVSQ